MADQEKDKQLDALLDSLLSQYSDVEPRPGLETRILSNLQEAGNTSTAPWWRAQWVWMGVAAPAVLAIVISILVFSNGRQEHPPRVVNNNPPAQPLQAPSPRPTQPEQQGVEAAAAVGRHIMRLEDRAAATSAARQEVFPTPVPLSGQEKLALRYLARTPREELVAQSHPDRSPDEDLLQGPQGVFSPSASSRSSGFSN